MILTVFMLIAVVVGCGRDDIFVVGGSPYVTSSTWNDTGFRQPETGLIVKGTVCITYSYDGRGKLTLTALPGWFNCCVDTIAVSARFSENTICVGMEEYPTGGGCHSTCYYSVGCVVVNVPPGVYDIELFNDHSFINPHREFRIDISRAVTDTACSPIY